MPLDSSISELASQYPLSPESLPIEIFTEDIQVESNKFHLIGLSLETSDHFTITSSAVDINTLPSIRAYFELIERFSTWKAIAQSDSELHLLDIKNEIVSAIDRSEVFPSSPKTEDWTYSKSNGVAAHLSFEKASQAAAIELIERDRILRSWYLGPAPDPMEITQTPFLRMLQSDYQIKQYSFSLNTPTVALFGFPKQKHHPLIYGFGASEDLSSAVIHAEKELLQRWAFLWGETLPQMQPDFASTPDFHQDYYLFPENIPIIEKWLNNEFPSQNQDTKDKDLFRDELQLTDISYIDLTPTHLKSKLSVIKAYSKTAIPLTFGSYHPHFNSIFNIHPIA